MALIEDIFKGNLAAGSRDRGRGHPLGAAARADHRGWLPAAAKAAIQGGMVFYRETLAEIGEMPAISSPRPRPNSNRAYVPTEQAKRYRRHCLLAVSLFWQRIDSERFSFAAEILGRRQLGRRKNSKPPAVLLLFPGVLLRGSASVVLSSVPGTGPCLALARVRAKREGIRTNLLKFLNLTSGNR